jgi:hypothetical protein
MVNIPIERLPAENKKDGLSVGYRIHYPIGLLLYQSGGWPSNPSDMASLLSGKRLRLGIAATDWFLAHWSVFLKPQFGIESWSVVVLQPENHVLALSTRTGFFNFQTTRLPSDGGMPEPGPI